MKITLYTITECPFSKQEKEYLSSHGLQFEEKNLETNKEFLTEMLAVGSNFAGTPVTKIEKDDGTIAVLKGFTAAEFDKTLVVEAVAAPVVPPVEPVQTPEAAAPVVETVPPSVQAPEAPPVEQPVVPTPPPQPEVIQAPTTTDPAMASLLNNLEQKTQVVADPMPPAVQAPVAQVAIPPVAPVAGTPVIPDPQF